jgi:hypothetical protein
MGELRGPDELARSPMGFVAPVEMTVVSVECEAGGVQVKCVFLEGFSWSRMFTWVYGCRLPKETDEQFGETGGNTYEMKW